MLKTGAADFVEIPSDYADEMEAAGLHLKRRAGGGTAALLLGGMVLPTREGYDPTCPWVPHQDEPVALADSEAGWGVLQTGGSEWNRRALKVRMAMTYAINVDAIIENMFYGDAEKGPFGAGGNWAPFGSSLIRPEWKPMPYDPALARQLLDEAGYPDGFELRFIIYESERFPRAAELAEAVSRDLEAIGLTVKREMVDYAVQRPWWADRESAWMVKFGHYGPFQEPWSGGIWYENHSTNDAYNDGYENLELDALLDICTTTLDYDERQEAIMDMGDFFWPRYAAIPVVITSRVFAMSEKIEDVPIVLAPFDYEWGYFEYTTRAD
jgi:ABC-type transport system substrate-binding protein